jgi:hypothetical protein
LIIRSYFYESRFVSIRREDIACTCVLQKTGFLPKGSRPCILGAGTANIMSSGSRKPGAGGGASQKITDTFASNKAQSNPAAGLKSAAPVKGSIADVGQKRIGDFYSQDASKQPAKRRSTGMCDHHFLKTKIRIGTTTSTFLLSSGGRHLHPS